MLSSILSLSNYDIFEMPDVLARASPRDWKEADAREYYGWLLKVKPRRVAQIMTAASVDRSYPRETVLRAISELLGRSLANLTTPSSGDQIATGLGLIACFDAAVVVGDYLVEDVPLAQWCIMRSRIKTLVSKNMTVVRRRLSMGFEPFLEGRWILNLLGRAGVHQGTVLQQKYEAWATDLLLDDLGDR